MTEKNIKLIDVDSEIPNLALMKISKYYKDKGHNVGWNISKPDKIFASVVFKKNKHLVDGLKFFYPDADIIIGGTGYKNQKKLDEQIENKKPDYSLYPDIDYSLGFTSRGCIRNCDFCVVRQKEGVYKRHRHPREFHDKQFSKIKLLDNNIFADKEWFMEITDWILKNNLSVDINQGMDIRLIDKDIADRISQLSFFKPIKFAWDNIEDEKKVLKGIDILKKSGVDLRSDLMFYVLTNFNSSHKEDLYRCLKLKKEGTNAFVMQYKGGDYFTKHLARWANRKWLFWSVDFIDYDNYGFRVSKEVSKIYNELEIKGG